MIIPMWSSRPFFEALIQSWRSLVLFVTAAASIRVLISFITMRVHFVGFCVLFFKVVIPLFGKSVPFV